MGIRYLYDKLLMFQRHIGLLVEISGPPHKGKILLNDLIDLNIISHCIHQLNGKQDKNKDLNYSKFFSR